MTHHIIQICIFKRQINPEILSISSISKSESSKVGFVPKTEILELDKKSDGIYPE